MVKNKEFTVIDLFAGSSDLTEGLYWQGFKAMSQVEYDHYGCESLLTKMKHYVYPEKKLVHSKKTLQIIIYLPLSKIR
jgi:DNA (cytosine-5)-methyltransferase 1